MAIEKFWEDLVDELQSNYFEKPVKLEFTSPQAYQIKPKKGFVFDGGFWRAFNKQPFDIVSLVNKRLVFTVREPYPILVKPQTQEVEIKITVEVIQ